MALEKRKTQCGTEGFVTEILLDEFGDILPSLSAHAVEFLQKCLENRQSGLNLSPCIQDGSPLLW